MCVCVSGQSVRLGMGGSGSRPLPHLIWTLCHLLSGLLHPLFHWRVSGSHIRAPVTPGDALAWSLPSLSLQGFCSAAFIWKDKLRETPGKVRTLLPAIDTDGHTEGAQTLASVLHFNLLCLPQHTNAFVMHLRNIVWKAAFFHKTLTFQ